MAATEIARQMVSAAGVCVYMRGLQAVVVHTCGHRVVMCEACGISGSCLWYIHSGFGAQLPPVIYTV